MKILLRKVLALPLLFLLGGCVDETYDLSQVDSSQIAIGEDSSVFRMPLATIYIGLEELAHNGEDIESVFAEVDVWLPSNLEGDYVDLERLVADPAYLDSLLDALIDEMIQSEEKRRAVSDLVWVKYKDVAISLFPNLPSNASFDVFYIAFSAGLENTSKQDELIAEMRRLAEDYITKINLEDIHYSLSGFELSEEVIDMLAKNLDPKAKIGEPNTLCLYGSIGSKLPVSMRISPSLLPTNISTTVVVEANTEENPIEEVLIQESDIRQLSSGVELQIPIVPTRYYPHTGFDHNSPEAQLSIELKLVKRGGLSL